jgi:hypothetical protein
VKVEPSASPAPLKVGSPPSAVPVKVVIEGT